MAVVAPLLQPAYVLHRRRYRESSLIIELFTAHHGRYGVVAKGALKNKRQGLLEPFQPLLVEWRGRGELPTLTQVEAIAALPVLQGRRLYCGLYLNELLMRLLVRNDPHAQVFSLYSKILGDFASSQEQEVESLLRRFELVLLEALGFGVNLQVDHEGQPIDASERYVVEPDAGPRKATGRQGVSGKTLLDLQACNPATDPVIRREARDLLRGLLAQHLGPEPLKSRELFL